MEMPFVGLCIRAGVDVSYNRDWRPVEHFKERLFLHVVFIAAPSTSKQSREWINVP